MDSDMKAAELADKLEQGGICRITPEEEALRLLKWMVKYWDLTGKLEGIAEGCVVEPWKENASKILVLCSKESPNAD